MLTIAASTDPKGCPPARFGPMPGATTVAAWADGALRAELMLTPKPGLVDRRNSGSHRDMNLETLLASARALLPWWPRFVDIGEAGADVPADEFLPLARITGLRCERAMMAATAGVNTHKGAVFSFGLLCAAAGRLRGQGLALTREGVCTEVARMCKGLVQRELAGNREARTAGERIFQRHGLTGARGEAAAGYSLVRSVALPVYDDLRSRGVDGDTTLLQVLLHLLAINGDTNLVSRGGLAGLSYVQDSARTLLREGGVLAPGGVLGMAAFDDALIARHLSPGGSADLLAVTWFLARFPSSQERLACGGLSSRRSAAARDLRARVPAKAPPRVRRRQNGPGSSPCSTPQRNRGRTAPARPRCHRPQPGPGAPRWTRR